MELEDRGAAPEVAKPRPVPQSAVEDGQEGEQVATAAYQDDQEDVEDGQDPDGVLSQDLRLATLSLLVETVRGALPGRLAQEDGGVGLSATHRLFCPAVS